MFAGHLWEELGEDRDRVEVAPSIGQQDNPVFPRGHEWSLYYCDGVEPPEGDRGTT